MNTVLEDGKIVFLASKPIAPETSFAEYSADLNKKIAMRAYELFERRGKMHGHDVDDWLAAENQVLWELH